MVGCSLIFFFDCLVLGMSEWVLNMIKFESRMRLNLFVFYGILAALVADNLVIPILGSASMSGHGAELEKLMPGGLYSDMSSGWYEDLGKLLVSAALVLALRPMINTVFAVLKLKISRIVRSKFIYRRHTNNKRDRIKFFELETGPEFQLHVSSALLTASLVPCIVLGSAFPLLYLIGLFSVILHFSIERILITKMYRLSLT
jgi:hypothetical protein